MAAHTEADRLAFLYRFVSRLNRVPDAAALFEQALDALQESLGVSRCAILLYDDDRVMRFVAWRGLSPEYRAAAEGHSPWSPDDPSPQPVVVRDALAEPSLAAYTTVFIRENIRAIAFIPLVYEMHLLGKFVLYSDKPYEFSNDEIMLASTIGSHVAASAARHASLRALAERELRLRLATQAAQMGVWEWDIQQDRVSWSDRMYQILGLPAGSRMDRKAATDLIHPDDVDRVSDAVDKAVQTRGACREEFRVRLPSGEYRWVSIAGSVISDEHGRPDRLLGTMVDITESMRIRQTLASVQERFSRFMRHLPAAAFIKDTQGRYVYANPVAEKVLGGGTADIVGKSDDKLLPPQIAGAARASDLEVIQKRETVQVTETFNLEDGPHHFIVNKFPIVDPDATVLVGAVAVDITERLQAEEKLRSVDARLDLAMTAGNMGTWEWHFRTGVIVWSPSLEEIHGLAAGTFDGTFESIKRLIHPDDADTVISTVQTAANERKPYRIQYRIIRPNGQLRWLEVRGKVFFDSAGQPERMAGVCIDITERKQVEDELREANRQLTRVNDNLRQFSYAASHDLKEPLRQLSLYAQLLQRNYGHKLDEEANRYLSFCVRGSQRVHDLINDLLVYIEADKGGPAVTEPVDANRALGLVIENLSAPIAESKATITSDRLPMVLVHEAHLVQLFQNLIQNAIKYRHPERLLVVHVGVRKEDPWWVFSVRDNGSGIAAEHYERIFRIFNRVRSDVQGTGMGLAICQKIVERYRGRIWVDSTVNVGTTFYFSLPQAPPSPSRG